MNGNGAIVDGTGNVTYDKDGPEEVTIFLEDGMTRDTHYTAVISVTTAVNTERTEIQFSEQKPHVTIINDGFYCTWIC